MNLHYSGRLLIFLPSRLIFAPSDRVDAIWASVASGSMLSYWDLINPNCVISDSLVSGPLEATVAVSAKVATSPEYETQGYQHVICVYIPDVYDKENVTEVWPLVRFIAHILFGC